jgi:hypothetical protein
MVCCVVLGFVLEDKDMEDGLVVVCILNRKGNGCSDLLIISCLSTMCFIPVSTCYALVVVLKIVVGTAAVV